MFLVSSGVSLDSIAAASHPKVVSPSKSGQGWHGCDVCCIRTFVPRAPKTRRKAVQDALHFPLRKVEVKINTGFRAAGPD